MHPQPHHTSFTPANLEIALFSPTSLPLLLKQGVSRIELNAAGSYASAGLTPTQNEVHQVASILTDRGVGEKDFTLRVMIRPHNRDFFYTPAEIETMRLSILELGKLLRPETGDGFVFGCLTRRGERLEVDEDACLQLVGVAQGMGLKGVFHRACDMIMGQRKEETLKSIRRCGFDGILTAGGADGGAAGQVWELKDIVRIAEGMGLKVVVGGGVRSGNVERLLRSLGGKGRICFHSAALKGDGSEDVDGDEVGRMLESLGKVVELAE